MTETPETTSEGAVEETQPEAGAKADPEFDAYSEDYDAGQKNPLKRLAGAGPDDFIAVKVRWLRRYLKKRSLQTEDMRLLDFGCGAATFLRLLRQSGFEGHLEGCDVSSGMLEEAARQWGDGEPPRLTQITPNERTPFDDDQFDVIVISAVLHHVPIADRPALYVELARLLAPCGHLVVFEHNPYNPVTTFVVKRTPIDADAILLKAREVRSGAAEAGLGISYTRYLMFFPPRFRFLWPVEDLIGWLGLGGQYAVVAHR